MMRQILFFISIIVITESVFVSDNEWYEWKNKYNKSYESDMEEFIKYKIWQNNMMAIKEHNNKNLTFTLGSNYFTDLSNDEFTSQMLGYKRSGPIPTDVCEWVSININYDVSDAIDWRNHNAVTDIKNQGSCGSCWAFSAIGAIEGILAIASGELLDLSEQQLIDCSGDEGNAGCRGGIMDYAFNYTIKNGICSNRSYPYIASDNKCNNSCNRIIYTSGCRDIQSDNINKTEL